MTTIRLGRHTMATLLILTAGCYPEYEPDPGAPGGATEAHDATTSGPSGSDGAISASATKPNVMLLIDRSGSMSEPGRCDNPPCESKWDQLLMLSNYLSEVKVHARLGLSFFPSTGRGCDVQGAEWVPLTDASDVDQQILSAAMRASPGGRTPLAAALEEVGRTASLDAPDRRNILLVLTDGQPNCTCEGVDPDCERDAAVAAVTALRARPTHLDIDIIGFGDSAASARETLTALARAAGDDDYYQASSIENLIATLYSVAARNMSCTFHLDEWPAAEGLVVTVDGEPVSPCGDASCLAGYTYDPANGVVELQGASCEALRDGQRHDVRFESR